LLRGDTLVFGLSAEQRRGERNETGVGYLNRDDLPFAYGERVEEAVRSPPRGIKARLLEEGPIEEGLIR